MSGATQTMTIGGEQQQAPSSFGVVNPATGEVHAEAPDCSREQLDQAFDAAAKAFVDWQHDDDARREALRRAADATTFGMSGSVWSADADRADAVAARLECGTAWVNTHLAMAPHQPFGGLKWSGIGVENGPWGLAGFTEIQVRYRART